MTINGTSEFEMFQSTKVQIRNLLTDGVEVDTRSTLGKLGFIPYSNLSENRYTLQIGQAIYVKYIGQDRQYLYFVEDKLFNPTTSHMSGLEKSLISVRNDTINVIKLFLSNWSVVQISSDLKMSQREVLEIIEKFESN